MIFILAYMTFLNRFNYFQQARICSMYTNQLCDIVFLSYRSFFDHSMHSALPLGIYLATKFWMYVTWFFWFWNDILSLDLSNCAIKTV